MPGIIGKKIGMTRTIQKDGKVCPVTVVKCDNGKVVQIKTLEKDGYSSVVVQFAKKKKEFKVDENHEYKVGDELGIQNFEEGEMVKTTSVSKGKGFQGVIKRHNFARGPETHGSHHHREPGSIGACAKPGRVHKGKKMPGRMGGDQITLKNINIEYIDSENNLVCLKGSIPGSKNSNVIISK